MNQRFQIEPELNQARGKAGRSSVAFTNQQQNAGGYMNLNDIKQAMAQCPDLAGLGSETMADLLWRAEQEVYQEGEIIYKEADPMDHTFCLLLQGDLIVEKGGTILAGIFPGQIFGEMAFFINEGRRTATVQTGSPTAVVLRFRLDPRELESDRLAALKKCLSLRTWDHFVSVTQKPSECDELVAVC